MSFIQFESGREKDRARQELREVREELLKRAEQSAKRRDEQDLQKKFRGDDQWMLPSISRKIDKISDESKKLSKKSKKSKKLKKKLKKEKKKNKKKRRASSSSESDDASSSDEERISKKRKKKKHFSDADSSSSSSSESNETDEWVEKSDSKKDALNQQSKSLERDDWLGGMMLPTYSKNVETKPKKKDERKDIDSYDPAKSGRELNPYWKGGGGGLPTFQKPSDDSDSYRNFSHKHTDRPHQPNWKKKTETEPVALQRRRSRSSSPKQSHRSNSSSSSQHSSPSPDRQVQVVDSQVDKQSLRSDFLTDQQMNELGAKLVKAEIMGKDELVTELKTKLDRARQYRTDHKQEILAKSFERRSEHGEPKNRKNDNKDNQVLLTATNSKGMSRPVVQTQNENDLWGGRAGRKAKKQKPVETHSSGERIRYFPDDDKYDIKQMFEREKFVSGADQDMQFANIAGKHKNPNDDLDDIFTEKVRKVVDDKDLAKKERDRAIHEHQQLSRMLDACDKCFDSIKLEKQLIVAMGTHVYLSLPWHEGLQTGHCIISPLAHISCATQLDEDVWEEVRDFMKAIDRMFASRKQDVIFFETAGNLHRRPHMVIHCVPSRDFEMAPFYFKKAIQEAEGEWATNKQLISLKERDVRRAIPKGLPYFWVNFGMNSGFAHVIEEQERFPNNFAQEIIGGLLNLDARQWRRPRKIINPIPKVKQFADWWKPFDVTNK